MRGIIIGLAGKKNSGKSEVARILVRHRGFTEATFAGELKATARRLYGLSNEQVNGTQEEKEAIDPRWGLSPRQILQRLGTNVGREVHPLTWIRALERVIDAEPHYPWVVPDARFQNEVNSLRARGATILCIVRPGLQSSDDHASESGDGIVPDALVINDGTLEELETKVLAIVDGIRRGT